MTTLLIVLAVLFMQRNTEGTTSPSISTQVFQEAKTTDNQAVAQAAKPAGPDFRPDSYRDEDFGNLTPSLPAPPNLKSDFLNLKSEIKTPHDSSFYQKLFSALSLHTQALSPEKVYLQFDRLFFEPGEDIWFNAYLRDANSLKASPKSDILYVELLGPNGSVLKKINLMAKGGTAAGDFKLEPNAPGGLYKIRAYTNWMRNANDAFERDIQVQATVLPRLRMELDFIKKAYGPGDVVEAKIDLNTLANAPLTNYDFTAKASLYGQQFTEVAGKTDGRGHAKVKFDLPKGLETNDGLLNILISYNGQTESISRSIPIVLNKIDLQFMPEGGDMVAGLPATVAFKALNEWGKPADIAGKIVNSKGVEVARFESYHQGMGAFNFTPASGENYHAVLTKPEGITEKYGLADAFPRGFSMKINPLQKDELTVEVNSTEDEALHVALVCRGEVKYMQTLPARAGSHLVRIPVKSLPIGIAQVTLFDSRELPRAERLVFLNHDKQLKISVKTDKEKYMPREKVTMTVSVTDERGLPMPGQFSLAVADDNLLTFADDRQGHILSHLLLESELKGKVEEPNFYFEPKEKHPEKNELLALDYLMLTQGWRRLAWEEMLGKQSVAMQFENERAVMTGIMLDEFAKPIARQKVILQGTSLTAMTDENGVFTLDTLFDNAAWMKVKADDSGFYHAKNIEFKGPNSAVLRMPCLVSSNGVSWTENPKSMAKIARLSGVAIDEFTEEPLIGLTVLLKSNGKIIKGAVSDVDGSFNFDLPATGNYDVELTYTGYQTVRLQNISLIQGKTVNVLPSLKPDPQQLSEVVVVGYGVQRKQDATGSVAIIEKDSKKRKAPKASAKKEELSQVNLPAVELAYVRPIIEQDNSTQGKPLTSEEIKALPTRDVISLSSSTAGVSSVDEGADIGVRGSRTDATAYFIDGVRVTGNLPPKQALNGTLSDKLPGIPAQFDKDIQMNVEGSIGEKLKLSTNYNTTATFDFDGEEDIISQIEAGNVSLPLKAQTDLSMPGDLNKKMADRNRTNFSQQNLVTQFHAPRQFYAPKYGEESAIRNPQSATRDDFRKTVFFAPKLEIGRNGRAIVEFYNTDAISTFRATVEGLGTDGSIGRTEQRFFTQMPFSMDVKVPVNLLIGDRLAFPLALTNNTAKALTGKLSIEMPNGFSSVKNMGEIITLKPGESTTIYPEYLVGLPTSDSSGLGSPLGVRGGGMKVSFESNGQSDAFTQALKVQPRGFPVDLVFGGNDRSKTFTVPVKDVVEGSLTATFTVHPSVLSDLTTGLERMIRQPNGCFEQTSSTNYPNLLVVNLLGTTNNYASDIVATAMQHLDFGYKRLKTFEVKGGGFDWYGKPPAHESLTAYGLMQFVDMKAVYPVEQELIDRTADWLLNRRDGKGGWMASQQGLHSWHQQSPVRDAYITWAMTEAGYGKRISNEMTKLVKDARETQDPYIVALAAKSLLNIGDRRAEEFLAILTKSQATDGSWTGKTVSMTHSTGKNLTVETTALATLALLANINAAEGGASATEMAGLNKAVTYLAGAKTQYGFGSTQATVLALKALVANAKFMKKSIGGEVQLFVNSKSAGTRKFTANESNALVFNGLEQYFTEGKNEVKVKFADGDALPYDLSVKYSTTLPYSNPDCKLALKTVLSCESQVASLGETVRLSTAITNRASQAVPNPIAIVGIPAGLSVQPWQVKQMQERGLMDFYEIKESYVVFYFRGMDPGEVKELHLDLKADVPGEYEAPASAAWLYYSNDAVVWSKPERVVIGKLGN